MQIDRHGNYNLHQLGPDPDRPKVRFPGGYGGGLIYYAARRTVVFRTEHTRRSLVEKVDFISAAGGDAPGCAAARQSHEARHAQGMLPLRQAGGRAAAGYDTFPLDARRHTGEHRVRPRRVGGPVAVTPAPSAEELRVLRGTVREKMLIASPAYAAWARGTLVEQQSA